jgi:hypothetical protein
MNISGFHPASLAAVDEMLEGYYDFTRCERPDGSAYGTKGQCKSGTPKADKKVAQIGIPIPEGESAEDVLQRLLPKGAVVDRPVRSA